MRTRERRLLLAHDLGTSGNKATLFCEDGSQVAASESGYSTMYPHPGFVEQDPEDWWRAVCETTRDVLSRADVSPSQVVAVGFSGQMMGCLPVDHDGNPLRNSIIWADLRSGKQASDLERVLGNERVYSITGHRISSSYSGTKLRWIRDQEPEVYARTHCFLQAKDFIIHRLTGEFLTDYSDASGTNLFDIHEKVWSTEIAEALGIQTTLLPDAFPSTHRAGIVHRAAANHTGLLEGTPVFLGGGDGVCAAVGATVVSPGSAYVVIGTSSWIATASDKPVMDPSMRTFNWIHADGKMFSPCGTMQSAGFSFAWLRDRAGEFAELVSEGISLNKGHVDASLSRAVAQSKPGSSGLLFLPYLLGERSPHWNPLARGAFVGLGATHNSADLTRSVLEGVAFNLKTILAVFRSEHEFSELVAIGGGAKNLIWLQIIADVLNVKILIPKHLESATSLGAAVCAGVGVGALSGFSDVSRFNEVRDVIEPDEQRRSVYDDQYPVFCEAYEALRKTYDRLYQVQRSEHG